MNVVEAGDVSTTPTTTDHPPTVSTFDITIPIIPSMIGLLVVVMVVIAVTARFLRRRQTDGNG